MLSETLVLCAECRSPVVNHKNNNRGRNLVFCTPYCRHKNWKKRQYKQMREKAIEYVAVEILFNNPKRVLDHLSDKTYLSIMEDLGFRFEKGRWIK